MSFADNHMATVGVDFIVRTIEVDNQLIKLQVWDTAGQERFRSVTSAYYRGAMGAIVCYDSLDENSFRNSEQWMTEFQTKARNDAPMVLAATKKDLINDEVSGVVQPRRGKEMADKFDASFMMTSAYTGENVNAAYEMICRRILASKTGQTSSGNGQSQAIDSEAQQLRAKNQAAKGQTEKKGCC